MANAIITDRIGFLYKLVFPNGKIYIGITSRTVQERFYEHCKTAKNAGAYAVHKAIRKYGADNVLLETLAVGKWSYLTHIEKSAIVLFNAKSRYGYNLTDGGEGKSGYVISEEVRLKLSLSHRGKRKPLTEETKVKISQANTGKKRTPEQNKAMSLARKGQKISPDNLRKLIAINTGKKRTDAEKSALSLAHKGKTLSEEHKAKLSAAKKGKKLSGKSLEHIQNLHKAAIGKKLDPKMVARRVASRKANAQHISR